MSDTSIPAALPKFYIATPSHDHKFHACYAFSIFRLQQALAGQCKLHLSKVGGAGVARARNNQAHEFLTKTDCDYFFCIDGDIGFTPEQFARIAAHAIQRELENVNGLYPLKDEALRWCVNPIPGEEIDPKTGLQKVYSAGTGFKCIRRSAFEKQIEAHPEIAYSDDLIEARGVLRWDFFSMGVVGPNSFESRVREIEKLCAESTTPLARAIREVIAKKHPPGRYLTEDWYFDRRHRDLGGEVHVDCTFHLKHEGLIAYPLKDPFASDEESGGTALWPADFLAAGIAPDHCADVLDGAYEIPFSPAVPPVILDIGANIGAFASWASARWPGCRLHCYEPDPRNFALLEKTVASIRAESESLVACSNLAVLDRAAVMPLRRGAHNCGEHSLFDVGEQTAETVDVHVMPASLLPQADILKLDTEGAEWPILSMLAADRGLSSFFAILLEYHSENDRTRIVELVEAAGFALVASRRRCLDRGELKFLRKIDSGAPA